MINALNLGLRFVLEILALTALGYWGFTAGGETAQRMFLGLGTPLLFAVIWAVFRVPGDGGPPVVEVSGPIRLFIEILLFGSAVWLLARAGQERLAIALFGALLIHYGLAYERLLRLLG